MDCMTISQLNSQVNRDIVRRSVRPGIETGESNTRVVVSRFMSDGQTLHVTRGGVRISVRSGSEIGLVNRRIVRRPVMSGSSDGLVRASQTVPATCVSQVMAAFHNS